MLLEIAKLLSAATKISGAFSWQCFTWNKGIETMWLNHNTFLLKGSISRATPFEKRELQVVIKEGLDENWVLFSLFLFIDYELTSLITVGCALLIVIKYAFFFFVLLSKLKLCKDNIFSAPWTFKFLVKSKHLLIAFI